MAAKIRPLHSNALRWQESSQQGLAPYAADPEKSRGRRYPEPAPTSRSEFQRDRDRIIHCTAFRRLEYKTQVFVNHEGDLFRTRLTHSLEVAQIARSISRSLRLNEDLSEAISLAHDLGHTPFGHAGQDALNTCMKSHGGFEHNLQSIRVVDELEERYGGFDGINLTFETREGILKHCSLPNARRLGDIGRRFIEKQQPSLEAQLTDLADEIAYNNHDIDDGLRSGLVRLDQMSEVSLFARYLDPVRKLFPGIGERRLILEVVRRIINYLILDLLETTAANLERVAPGSSEAVREAPRLVDLSPQVRAEATALKQFLHANLYQHYQVERMSNKARRIVTDLFHALHEKPQLLPTDFHARAKADLARTVADYIAGMTDRYAILEHRRLFAVENE